jgi:hypothetical protein
MARKTRLRKGRLYAGRLYGAGQSSAPGAAGGSSTRKKRPRIGAPWNWVPYVPLPTKRPAHKRRQQFLLLHK